MTWEETFRAWAKGPSEAEDLRCKRTERVIIQAIKSDPHLAPLDIFVFTQGSYKNKTNVRLDSDVDICVLLRSHYLNEYPAGKTAKEFGFQDVDLTFAQYKLLVANALKKYFGSNSITVGNKAINVHELSGQVAADVLPAFRHRRYENPDATGEYNSVEGIAFWPDTGYKIINWPDQTYDNGVWKNNETRRIYKRSIRIIKKLRNRMQEEKIETAKDIESFLIESLVWNVPTEKFIDDNYSDTIRNVLAHTFNGTINNEKCYNWGEVNELKYLFRASPDIKRVNANNFLLGVWDYIGYK